MPHMAHMFFALFVAAVFCTVTLCLVRSSRLDGAGRTAASKQACIPSHTQSPADLP